MPIKLLDIEIGKNTQLETIIDLMYDGNWYSPRDILGEFDILSSSSTAILRMLRTREYGWNIVLLRRDLSGKTLWEYQLIVNPEGTRRWRNQKLRELGIDPNNLPEDFLWLHPQYENYGKLIAAKIKKDTYRGYTIDFIPAFSLSRMGIKVSYTNGNIWKGKCRHPIDYIEEAITNTPNIKHVYLEMDGKWELVYINQ